MNPWIDITVPLRSGMVHWPGDIPVSVDRVSDMDSGALANVREIHMSAHTGTHMDAPLHFIANGRSIDEMPFEATCGLARVVAVEGPKIGLEALRSIKPQRGERLLFKTENSSRCWKRGRCFLKNFVALDTGGAQYLVDCGVQTIGVDYLSFGPYGEEGVAVHRIVLGAGLWAIEGLDLSAVEPGSYELVCLPLKLQGGDGAPARAMLRTA